jgi:hypothetical protein
VSRLLAYRANYGYAEGLGLRIACNINLILRFDAEESELSLYVLPFVVISVSPRSYISQPFFIG